MSTQTFVSAMMLDAFRDRCSRSDHLSKGLRSTTITYQPLRVRPEQCEKHTALRARRFKKTAKEWSNTVKPRTRDEFTSFENNQYNSETIAAQADGWRSPITGEFPPPISLGVTYARDENYQTLAGRAYLRDQGSTGFEQVESVVSQLEQGIDATLFSSGMAAASAVFACLPVGSRVVVAEQMYFGLTLWLREFGRLRALDVVEVDASNVDMVRTAVEAAPTALLWIETPANPTWLVTDIAACAQIARDAGALLAVDNTVPTPFHTRPLALGAHIVMHSGTKYLNGHGDVIAGFLVRGVADEATTTDLDELWATIGRHRRLSGAVLGPFETYLLTRGIRTLAPRMRHVSATAQIVAEHFTQHPLIRRVSYPGLESDPGHVVASKQMTNGYSGMLSLHVNGSLEQSLAVANGCRLFIRATSLGGPDSLIEHRYTFEGPGSAAPLDMLRLSIGLEEPDDLIADLERSLDYAATL